MRKAHAALSRKGLIGTDFVISEASSKFNAYRDGKTVVIGKDMLTNGTYIEKLVHEVEHFAEGTKEWAEFASFVFDNSAETNAAIDTVANSGYGITEQDIATLGEGLKNGNLTKGQRTLISEVVALRSEALFGSEQAIMKLTRENRTLAGKILDRIKQFLQVFTAKTPEERASVKRLQEAQRLFERALGKAGTKYVMREMQSTENGGVLLDGEGVLEYNNTAPQFSTKRAKYISYDKLGASTVAFIRRQLYKFYQDVENGIANNVAIENGNAVYIVDSGCENGDVSFGVRERIKILDDELRSEYVRRTNDDAVSKGYISDGLSSRFAARHANGRESNLRRESGEELSADTAESADIQGGIPAADADRRSGVKQYSRKTATSQEIKHAQNQIAPIDNGVGEVQYNYKDLYTTTDEYMREVAAEDRSDFDRWLANKTSDMQDGEFRAITIYCYRKTYFFAADGYMHGTMASTLSAIPKSSIAQRRKDFINELDKDTETSNLWANIVSLKRAGSRNDIFVDGDTDTTRENDSLFGASREGNGTRDTERSGENYQIDNDEVDRIIKGLREMIAKMDEESGKQYSRKFLGSRDVAYTEEQYRDFGWVRDNDVIPSGAWVDFTRKFAAALSGRENPPKTKGGEYMIAVSDIYNTQKEGINNVIVYATGSIETPQVSRVLEIDFDNETDLDRERRKIYDAERRGLQPASGGVFRLHNATDFGRGFHEQGKRYQEQRNNSQLGIDRGAGGSGVAEAERGQVSDTARTDSRLIPPATVPVRYEYVDITGNKRYVMAREGGQYSVYGTGSPRPYDMHPSIEAAIEAENNGLLRAYARETDHTVTWVKRQLQDNPNFLKAWGKKRLLEKSRW